MIVGGLAVNLHGVPRMTQDIDIIIAIEKENILALCDCLTNLGYAPRLPENPMNMADPEILKNWIEKRNLKAFSFFNKQDEFKVIDIVLVHPLNFEAAYQRKNIIKIQNIEIPLLAIDDLIEMKKFSGRPRDLSDIEMLVEAQSIKTPLADDVPAPDTDHD